eukprot:scaffold59999_cov31-Tisochrysis_lutea.AAC.2
MHERSEASHQPILVVATPRTSIDSTAPRLGQPSISCLSENTHQLAHVDIQYARRLLVRPHQGRTSHAQPRDNHAEPYAKIPVAQAKLEKASHADKS